MARYRMLFDLHTHTAIKKQNGGQILHAKGSVEENVRQALERGLSCIGISNHGPGHVVYGMPAQCISDVKREVEEARRRHPEIEILFGVEANIIERNGKLDVSERDLPQFDYVMAGYHYGIFGREPLRAALLHGGNWLCGRAGFARAFLGQASLRRRNTNLVLRAVEENRLKVLTHPGDKGPLDVRAVAAACAETGTWMEINNYHKDLSVEGIRIAAEYDVTFVIGSDAHRPQDVGSFEEGLERALEAGIPVERIVNIEKKG